jgi:hypothetical protein
VGAADEVFAAEHGFEGVVSEGVVEGRVAEVVEEEADAMGALGDALEELSDLGDDGAGALDVGARGGAGPVDEGFGPLDGAGGHSRGLRGDYRALGRRRLRGGGLVLRGTFGRDGHAEARRAGGWMGGAGGSPRRGYAERAPVAARPSVDMSASLGDASVSDS